MARRGPLRRKTIRAAWIPWDAASRRTRTRTCIATGSSRRSTTTCRTTSSSGHNSPRTCSTTRSRVGNLAALGFLGLGPWYYDNGAVEITRADERNDRVDVVSRGFLGLTVACARCHDHKYDPISARDYYALSGVFLNSSYTRIPAGAEVGGRRVQSAREEDQGQAEAAQRVHGSREPAACRDAGPAGGEIHARRLEGAGGAEGRGRRASPRKRSSITSFSTAG